jgi:hypothetical protein
MKKRKTTNQASQLEVEEKTSARNSNTIDSADIPQIWLLENTRQLIDDDIHTNRQLAINHKKGDISTGFKSKEENNVRSRLCVGDSVGIFSMIYKRMFQSFQAFCPQHFGYKKSEYLYLNGWRNILDLN